MKVDECGWKQMTVDESGWNIRGATCISDAIFTFWRRWLMPWMPWTRRRKKLAKIWLKLLVHFCKFWYIFVKLCTFPLEKGCQCQCHGRAELTAIDLIWISEKFCIFFLLRSLTISRGQVWLPHTWLTGGVWIGKKSTVLRREPETKLPGRRFEHEGNLTVFVCLVCIHDCISSVIVFVFIFVFQVFIMI